MRGVRFSLAHFVSPPPELHETGTIRKHRNQATKYAETKRVHETESEIRAVAHPGTIELSVNKGFPTQSGKSLKLETLDIDSRVNGLKNRWQGRHMQLLVCWQETLETHWKTRYR